ncbi:GNAT family N-acetyltransferase [Streptomyces formicae]|uniref:GNAT family N-acetyltransferase n=1 Tax=Streptomyces formicae TaxID=1616117 RepID=A0ABY3WL79_9ACTN|nr:GNAT family N-acetyltransferase [Streptomyces formicae]UNM12880.1 GNAT family N-acetyltransferase [Streptomyces formicae]
MTMVIEGSSHLVAPAVRRSGGAGIRRVDGVRPTDGPGLRALFDSCSPETVRLRFFGLLDELPRDYVDGVLACWPEVHDAVVAHRGDRSRLAGLASLAAPTGGGPGDAAVFCVLVADGRQRQGLGAAMVRALLARAAARGVERVTASVLPGRSGLLAALARRAEVELESSSRDQDGLTGVYKLTQQVRWVPVRRCSSVCVGVRRGAGGQ